MNKWQAYPISCVLVLALVGASTSDEPTVQPTPISNDYYMITASLRRGDPKDIASQKIISEPKLVVGGPLKGQLHVGPTIQIDGAAVDTGTTFQVRAERAAEGKVRVQFVHEVTNVVANAPEEPPGQVFQVTSSKSSGDVVLKPGVTAEVLHTGSGKDQTWLTLKVDNKQTIGLDVEFAPAPNAAPASSRTEPATAQPR